MSFDWETRFWAKVAKVGADDCWLWQGAISKNGYGSFKIDGYAETSSRAAWKATTGEAPGKMMVLHKCDNRPCCNPKHLYLGDVKQNSRDMVERGRVRTGPTEGASNGNAKLSEEAVVEIRRRIAAGETNVAIAPDFGVTHQMISKIRRGHFWKKVQGEAA